MEKACEELELAKAEIEKLKFTVSEKDAIIKHLSSANSRLRSESDEKQIKLEEENVRLLKALDEAEEKNKCQDRAIGALKSEVENIKAVLSAAQRKCFEAEKEAKSLKEGRQKENELVRLEDGKRKVEDQLKWKKEQFELLKQAHEKLKDQFDVSKREFELEKSSLLDEMSKMQANLDCKTSEAESLKGKLGMCKRAYEHEENRRRNLESRVSEMKLRLESVSDEYWEAKSKVYCSTAQRDDQITELRDSLREKESELKESEYKARKLEKENQDLLSSLRDLQEAHIPKPISTPPSSLAKLKSKLRSLEQTHKECSANLRSKEAEWSSQMEKMKKDLDDQKFCVNIKEAAIQDLKREIENCNSVNTDLKMQNEELSLTLQLFKIEVSETQPTTRSDQDHDIQKYKEMLAAYEKEQARLKEELKQVSAAMERLNSELTEEVCHGSEIELELQLWMFTVERLRSQLEENQNLRRELESSLLAQAGYEEELKLEINNLRQKCGMEDEDEGSLGIVEEEENANQQTLSMGKAREVIGVDERSPFREIN